MPKVWCNQKRLHFMDTSSYHQHPQRHANTSTSKYQVSTMPTHSRSSSSASGSIDENDCSTALTGQFSNVSVSSTSTATPNIRKPKQRNGGK
uniref:Uncharacterized protein n=1 Tax=Panagrolaimus superbus TaxID=310955 RepID=A0A914YAU6_9BILA